MIRVEHESDIGMARRAARDAAVAAGLDEEDVGRAALVATEVATNLARHGKSGAFFVRRVDPMEGQGVEIIAVDRGPGMASIERFMADGVSTRGTAGQGLGALRRVADDCVISSRVGDGTIVALRVQHGGSKAAVAVGGLTSAIADDGCGDGFAVSQTDSGALAIMVDGLGHGADAAAATEAAIETFRERRYPTLQELFFALDRALKPTRGAAIAVAEVDLRRKTVHFAGVGNINGVMLTGDRTKSLVSHNGIVGHTMRRVQQFDYPFEDRPTVILHTDGLSTRWNAASLAERGLVHPSLIAAHLWRSEARGRDDAGVVVLRAAA